MWLEAFVEEPGMLADDLAVHRVAGLNQLLVLQPQVDTFHLLESTM